MVAENSVTPVLGGARVEVAGGARPAATPERDGVARLGHMPGRWWVLHTRARNEKWVAGRLESQGVVAYVPLLNVRRTYAKAKFTFALPLFPGYVFLHGEHEACEQARRTNRVAQVLWVADQVQMQRELLQIERALEAGGAVELFPALQAGRRCRVVRGPLQGVEGTVIRRGQRCRMFLAVTMLGQSAVVEVDAALLEVVE